MNAAEIIEALGDTVAVSGDLGVQPSAVSNWKHRGIPARYWPAIARLAPTKGEKAQGISIEALEQHTFPGRLGAAA